MEKTAYVTAATAHKDGTDRESRWPSKTLSKMQVMIREKETFLL